MHVGEGAPSRRSFSAVWAGVGSPEPSRVVVVLW
jgi:hypothetical protein